MPFLPLIPKRYLMYQDSQCLRVCRWRNGALEEGKTFLPLPGDVEQLREYLEARKDHHFTLLANVAEEGYQQETIPALYGEDRQILVQRKLNQNFPATTLHAVFPLSLSKGWRKDERLLLSALTNPAAFDPWLGALRMTQQPFAGLYSLAQLGPILLRQVGIRAERALLFTVQDRSLRGSFIFRGLTHFSRRSELPDRSAPILATQLDNEVNRLYQHLLSQRLIAPEDVLPVYVLLHPADQVTARLSCVDSDTLRFHWLDLCQLARQCGLRVPVPDSRAETLFMHLLARQRPAQQYAGTGLRHDYWRSRLRLGLIYGGAGMLGLGLAWAGLDVYIQAGLQQEITSLKQATALFDQRYREVTATFPKVEISISDLRDLSRHFQQLEQQSHSPLPALQQLSRVLGQSPEIEIDQLEWIAATPGTFGTPGKADNPNPVTAPTGEVESLLVSGHLALKGELSPRRIVTAFTEFQRQLKQLPGVQVVVITPPIDFSSGPELGKSAQGVGKSTGPATASGGAALPQFALRLGWRAAPALSGGGGR